VTKSVSVTVPPNQPPVADFTSSAVDGRVTFTSTSTDADGTIASQSWAFGDGGTSTAANPTHTYAATGSYNVTLTVTDDDGASHSVTKSVSVTVPPNQPPVADFTAAANGSTVSFTSTSTDSDGTIEGWAWDFGDLSPAGSGATTSHTYAAPGTYQVTLTVTDDDGATHEVTKSVEVAAGPAVLARDTFDRTVASGFGSADQGGAWTYAGSATNFSVATGAGQIRMGTAGAGPRAFLGDVGSADTESVVSVALDKAPAGGDTYITLGARRVGNSEYRLKARFQPTGTMLLLTRVVNNTETNLSVATLPTAARYLTGDVFTMRLQVQGTSLRGRLWKAGQDEPTTWQVSATDSTPALAGAGGVALQAYISSAVTNAPVLARFDELTVTEMP